MASRIRSVLSRIDLVATAIVLLAFGVRLYRIDVPFVDAHSWRQVTNADIARLWAEGPIDFYYPAVSWGGPDGRVGLEFPLLHLLMALAWRVVGVSDVAGRMVSVLFSVATVGLTHVLGTRLFNRGAGRAAAFLMAVSPSVVYFGRTPISDTPMLTFSVGAVLAYVAYSQTERRPYALLGAVSLALAGLVKLPAVLVLGPVVWIGIVHRRRALLADPWYVAALLAALGAISLWYLHADQIYLETGLTQAIFRPSGTYPGDIAQWAGTFTTVSHWTRPDVLTRGTAEELSYRYWALHLTPIFMVITAAGVASWRWPFARRSVVDVWALAAFSLVMVSLTGQIPHEFHQLPTMPPLALYFGMAAAPFFDPARYRRCGTLTRRALGATVAVAFTGAAYYGFLDSGVIERLYRPNRLNSALIDAGEAIDRVTPKDALVVTIEYDRYGSNSPMLLYFAHRKGWSFDATSISPGVVTYLRERRGACFLAAGDWPMVESLRPDMTEFVQRLTQLSLPHTDDGYRLFDLGCASPGVARPPA